MQMIRGLIVVVALSVPAVTFAAGTGSITEDNVGVLKDPSVRALEVVRLGYKHDVQVGKIDGAWVQIRVIVTKGIERVSIQGWMQGRFVRLSNGSLASTEVVEEAFGNDQPDNWGAGGNVDSGWTEQAEGNTIEWPVMEPDESKADDNWLSLDAEEDTDDGPSFDDDSTESFFETEEPDLMDDSVAGSAPSWFD